MPNKLMEDLAAAWDEAEGATEEPSDDQYDATAAEADAGESGEQPELSAVFEDVPEPAVGQHQEAPAAEEQAAPDDTETAPKGLSPQAREDWANTPESVRKELAKREADFEKGVTQYAADAKRARQMDQVLGPYQQLFAMNGGPANILPGLLQTASLLQMGSPQQKAQQAAQLIKQFGVDIKMLDGMLVGQQPQLTEEQKIQAAVDQRMQPFVQQQQQAQAQQTQRINDEIAQFAQANEFYNDVKSDMADIMDLAANRGQEITLQQAYEKACQLRPDIAAILSARQASQGAQQRQRAASSIAGSPSGEGDPTAPQGIRATIENAWQTTGRV